MDKLFQQFLKQITSVFQSLLKSQGKLSDLFAKPKTNALPKDTFAIV